MPFNPYLALGAVLALIGAFLAGNYHGHDAESQVWQATIAQQKAQATQLLADQTAKIAAAEQTQAMANANLEQIRHEYDLKAADADSRVRAALARLRQSQGRGGCGSGALRASTGAGGAENASTGSSDGLASGLDDLTARTARAANELAAYARECHDFALSLQ